MKILLAAMNVGSIEAIMMAGKTVAKKITKTRYWRSAALFPRLRKVNPTISDIAQ